jgi:DNA gyrase subunit A
MSILRHLEVSPETRDAYLSLAAKRRRDMGEESDAAVQQDATPEEGGDAEAPTAEIGIGEEEFAEFAEQEQFVLSLTEKGFGVRTSSYDYRITGRGGQGIDNMILSKRADAMVDVFPTGPNDQVMLVTDGGMVIRTPVKDIRIARRRTQGVVVFRLAEGERVVSAARLADMGEENGGDEPVGEDLPPASPTEEEGTS